MPFKRLSSPGAVLIAVSARVSLLHGAPARPFLARSLRRSNFLFRCAVRVRATRFRQWRSEGVCAREIIRGKANRNDQETEEEPLISGLRRGTEDRDAMSLSKSLSKIRGSCFENFYRQKSKKFFCILDLQNRLRKVRCEKTCIWRSSNPRLSQDFAFG
jgi:hypothetical protein